MGAPKNKRTLRGSIWRWVTVCLLAPVIVAMVLVFPQWLKYEIRPIYFRGLRNVAVAFFSGAGVYVLLHIFLYRSQSSYLLAHELTHSLWSKLTGHRVKRTKAGKEDGQTHVEGGNFLVRLLPYCLPFYTAAVVVVWVLLRLAISEGVGVKVLDTAAFAAMGFTYAFHVLFTLNFLKIGQADLHQEGYCFSLSVILFANIEIGVALLWSMAHRSSWLDYQLQVWECLEGWGTYLVKLFR
jgi:hypothetical protein